MPLSLARLFVDGAEWGVATLLEPLDAPVSWLGCSKAAAQGDQSLFAISTFRMYDTALSQLSLAVLFDRLPRPQPLPEAQRQGRGQRVRQRDAVRAAQRTRTAPPPVLAAAATEGEPSPPQHYLGEAEPGPSDQQCPSSAPSGPLLSFTLEPRQRAMPLHGTGSHSACGPAAHSPAHADGAPLQPAVLTDATVSPTGGELALQGAPRLSELRRQFEEVEQELVTSGLGLPDGYLEDAPITSRLKHLEAHFEIKPEPGSSLRGRIRACRDFAELP